MVADKLAWRARIKVGDRGRCRVVQHALFGVFVVLSDGQEGIVERLQMERDGYKTPGEYPAIGSIIEGIVLAFREYNHQVDIGLPAKKF